MNTIFDFIVSLRRPEGFPDPELPYFQHGHIYMSVWVCGSYLLGGLLLVDVQVSLHVFQGISAGQTDARLRV